MLRNRAQLTSWKEHLIVTRGTPGWLKHAACMQVCSSRADFQVFTICSSVELAQICVRLRGEGCNPFCTYEHLVSALTWRQWGFFYVVKQHWRENNLWHRQGKSRWPRIGNSWLWCGSLTARMQPVDLCVACQECFILPSSMDASDLSISWSQSSCLRLCCWVSVLLLSVLFHLMCCYLESYIFVPQMAGAVSRGVKAEAFTLPKSISCSERCALGVAQLHNPLRQLCCQFLFQRTSF